MSTNGNKIESTPAAAWLAIVQQQVQSLQYGVVQIVVHNERVVQIERTEKFRLNEAEGKSTLTGVTGRKN